jgi:hypothetical protein
MRRHRLGNLLLDAVEIEARRLGGNSMNDCPAVMTMSCTRTKRQNSSPR